MAILFLILLKQTRQKFYSLSKIETKKFQICQKKNAVNYKD